MKARGSYRATYESIDDDRDWRRLSPLAKATFDTLKRRLGQYGIDVFGVETLPRIINCSSADMESALIELEAPKPGRAHGWIRREDEILWIVNGLRFEPTLFVEGLKPNANHRMAAARHGQQLYQLTHSPIVVEFMAYYCLGELSTNGKTNAIPDAMPHAMPIEKGMGGGITESESENESEIESESDARANGASPPRSRSAPPSTSIGYGDLPPDVIAFGATYYGRAIPDRRRKIANQLVRLARGEAVRYKGALIKAGSLDRLARKCREVMEDGDVQKPDAAIAVLLVKLGDSTDTSAKQLKQEQTERREDDRRNAQECAFAEAWILEHPDIATSVDHELERQGYASPRPSDPFTAMSRSWVRRGLLLAAWRNAGAPELAGV